MSYQLTITEKPRYVHFVVTGLNNLANVAGYLAEIQRESVARGCRRILIEERLEGPRLNTMEVFRAAAQGSEQALGVFIAIAYVDVNAEGDLMKFAETVAVNRALPVRVFETVASAQRWLEEETRLG